MPSRRCPPDWVVHGRSSRPLGGGRAAVSHEPPTQQEVSLSGLGSASYLCLSLLRCHRNPGSLGGRADTGRSHRGALPRGPRCLGPSTGTTCGSGKMLVPRGPETPSWESVRKTGSTLRSETQEAKLQRTLRAPPAPSQVGPRSRGEKVFTPFLVREMATFY